MCAILGVISFFFFYSTVCVAEVTDVVQSPLYKLATIGESVSVKCFDERSNYLTKYWYRQKDGAIVLMGYSYNAEEAQMEKDFPKDKMIIKADTALRSTLTISKVSLDDSAIYFCASSIHSGTRIAPGPAGINQRDFPVLKTVIPKTAVIAS